MTHGIFQQSIYGFDNRRPKAVHNVVFVCDLPPGLDLATGGLGLLLSSLDGKLQQPVGEVKYALASGVQTLGELPVKRTMEGKV